MEHRLILGGEQYLPFARSRIKALKAAGLKYASQSFEVGGVSINVKIVGEHEYIRLEGGSAGYEYLASDAGYRELTSGIGIEGATSALYPGSTFITGSGVRTRQTSKPVYAQTITDTNDPPRWPKVTIDDVLTNGALSGRPTSGSFYTFASRPNNQFQTYHWWYDNDPKQLVTSVCATGNGRSWVDRQGRLYSSSRNVHEMVDAESEFGYSSVHSDVGRYGVPKGWPYDTYRGEDLRQLSLNSAQYNILTQTFLLRNPQRVYLKASPITTYASIEWFYDGPTTFISNRATTSMSPGFRTTPATYYEGADQFDVAPASYTKTGIKYGAPKRTEQANWRHAALHIAKDDKGGLHRFIVSTDTHGVFTFYREADYNGLGYDARNIPAELTKVVRVEYPSWVTTTPDDKSCTNDHWQWSFNKDATRACTTPLNHKDMYLYLGVRDGFYNPAGVNTRQITIQTVTGKYSLAQYNSVRRLKIFASIGGQYVLAAEFEGKLLPINTNILNFVTNDFASDPGLTRSEFEPVKNTTPGFVEVDISVSVWGPGATDFTPYVSVRQSEQYADNSTYFMDCAYYISTPRGRAKNPAELEPDNDDLLTGEIEVLSGERIDDAWSYSDNPYNLYPDPPQLDAAAISSGVEGIVRGNPNLSNVYAFYTVRRRADKAVVKKLALMRGGGYSNLTLNTKDYEIGMGDNPHLNSPCFYGAIEQADLRFLSFITTSYSRRGGLLPLAPVVARLDTGDGGASFIEGELVPDNVFTLRSDYNGRVKILPHFLRPRFELRVHGEELRTIDYSRPTVTELTPETDIMSDVTVPDGVVDRSESPAHSSALLVLKHYLAANHFLITNNDTFSFSPDGSWAVYADRRSVPITPRPEANNLDGTMPLHPDSTEKSGVFDVISRKRGKKTTHKDEFNKAFAQTRDYDFYNAATGDLGGFGRCGIWANPK